jgi:hypothetical protein
MQGPVTPSIFSVSLKAAEIAAAKAFMLTEWQRKRLLVRERL